MKKLILFSISILSLGVASALELISPANNAQIQLMKDAQKAFVQLSQQERYDIWNNATDDNPEAKAILSALGEIKYAPLSIEFSWSGVNPGSEVTFTVKDATTDKLAYSFITKESKVTLRNFEIGRTYQWSVSDGHTVLSRTFTTESLVPRLMYTSHIVNWRDIGGRTGLNNKQIRQGLMYRCGQFNETSSDPENPGAIKLNAASVKYMTQQLGIKTDIDFREAAKECAGMTGSPLGSGVNWVRTSFKGYASFDTDASKACFQEIFAAMIDPAKYPIAFHCAGGADRTGSIAFIVEALLGCSEYDFELDYEITAFSTAINNRSYLINNFYPMKQKLWNNYSGDTWAEKAASYVKACGFTDADIETFRGIMLDGYDDVSRPAIAAIYPTANYLQNPDGDSTTYDYEPAATDYVWTNALGDDDWTKPVNFLLNGSVPAQVPGSTDIVVLPVGVSVYIDYDENDAAKLASANVFRNVKRIIPCGPRSVVRINVPQDQVLEVNCAIVRDKTDGWWKGGKITKLGAGEVQLKAYGLLKNSKNETFDYYVALNVVDGTLTLPQNEVVVDEHYGAASVAEGATLMLGRVNKSLHYNRFPTIAGAGTIKNDNPAYLYVSEGSTFAGKIEGRVIVNTRGYLRLTGTNSTYGSSTIAWYGHGKAAPEENYGAIGVQSFGMKGYPSSLGTNQCVTSRDDGAYFKYLGMGETTDCTLEINHTDKNADWVFLDAGETGGLNWTGNWLFDGEGYSTTKSYQHGLVLMGDGTSVNTMSGKVRHHPFNSQSAVYRATLNVRKQGTGTWRINENAGNVGSAQWGMRGVWEVQNGTLQFDSIADKGVQSALGSSDELFNNSFAVTQKVENAVDYAFVLGGGVGKTRGNLEYVGSASSTAAGRKFVVDGTGAFLNNGSSALTLSDFKVKSGSGDSTLVLGGANLLANSIDTVADGDNGKLGLVKEDAGTWKLGNDLSFTGPLVVKAGKLEVGEAIKYWQFYRWVVKDTFDYSSDTTSAGRNRAVGLKMLGLFDANGNDRVQGLTDTGDLQATPPSNCNYASKEYSYVDDVLNLEAGHFLVTGYDGKTKGLSLTTATEGGNNMTSVFSHPTAGHTVSVQSRSPQAAPDYFTTNTWFAITMRPVAGQPIVSWDYVNEYYNRSYQTISNCTLEASMDGKTWTQLAEKSQDAIPTSGTWASDNTTKYAADFTTHTGMAIASGPAGQTTLAFAGSSVSVAAGAELKFNQAVTVPKIVVEPTGMGSLSGVTLADNGVIDISPAPAGASADIAVDFSKVTLPTNYSFTIGGKPSTAEITLSADGRTLSVRRRGLKIIFK